MNGFQSIWKRLAHQVSETTPDLLLLIKEYFRLDIFILIIVVFFSVEIIPTIPVGTESWQTMQFAGRQDEAATVEVVESMTVFPYGNPSNYWDHPEKRPAFWKYVEFQMATHMQGLYFEVSCLLYLPFKLLGVQTFPTAPIIMRSLAFLGGLLSLILIYNLGRGIAGRCVGSLAAVVLLTENLFPYLSMWIGPRSFEILFGLLVVILCIEYIKNKNIGLLFVLGVTCGLFHTTKLGMLWMWPTILVTLIFVLIDEKPLHKFKWWRKILSIYIPGFVVGFFAALPYALMSKSYWRTLRDMVLTQKNIKTVNFIDWFNAIYNEQGVILSLLGIASTIGVFIIISYRKYDAGRPLIILSVTAWSCISFFSFLGTLWINTYYLILPVGLIAVVIGAFIRISLKELAPMAYERKISATVLLLLCLFVLNNRLFESIKRVLDCSFMTSPIEAMTKEVEKVIPPGSRIAYDLSGLTYVDTNKFPDQHQSGTMKYSDLWRISPDYLFMSPGLLMNDFYQNILRQQQNENRRPVFDVYPFSLRLYQDLYLPNLQLQDLSSGDDTIKKLLGETHTGGIELVQILRSFQLIAHLDSVGNTPLSATSRLDSLFKMILPNSTYQKYESVRIRSHQLDLLRNSHEYQKGNQINFLVYKIGQPGTANGMIGPFCSDYYDIYKPFYAFDKTNAAWQSKMAGSDVNNRSFLGFDFGVGQSSLPKTISLQWLSRATTPDTVLLQYADADFNWQMFGKYNVSFSPDAKGKADSTFAVPQTVGKHRLWRVLAAANLQDSWHFTIVEMTIE
jgi:hypothetical protein